MTSRLSAIVCVLVLFGPPAARADAVLEWNAIAVQTAIQAGQNPFAQARVGAIVQLAVFEAVNSITGDYEPYLGSVPAPAGASPQAAAVTAAYRVLVNYFGANATILAALDTARANSLAAVPDGDSETAGIAVGEAAAAAIIANRLNDGSAPPQLFVPSEPAPGVWRATVTCPLDPVTGAPRGAFLHWRNVRPFGIASAMSFLPGPPPALTSSTYWRDYAEVLEVGRAVTTARPIDREEVVRFYASASPTQVANSAARQVATVKGRSLAENARDLALLNMAISDALVVSFAAKYHYNLWRPETAIALGHEDGNPKTEASSYAPLIPTPCFPSYPSNHASGTSAGTEMLRRLYGAAGHTITLTNPALPAVVLHYSHFADVAKDVDDARVYGGIHFRFDQEGGNEIGRRVATEISRTELQPVHGGQ